MFAAVVWAPVRGTCARGTASSGEVVGSGVWTPAVSISWGKGVGSRGIGTGEIPVVGTCSASTAWGKIVGSRGSGTGGIPVVCACSASTTWGKGKGVREV